jgi:hypothetical protein
MHIEMIEARAFITFIRKQLSINIKLPLHKTLQQFYNDLHLLPPHKF